MLLNISLCNINSLYFAVSVILSCTMHCSAVCYLYVRVCVLLVWMIWCGGYGLQQEFFDSLCSVIDSSSDDDDDSLVDAAESVVLNGWFHVMVCSQFSVFYSHPADSV